MSFHRILRRPRYADVAATLALVLALSGTAYAVTTFADPNSVNTAAIQDKAVTTPKLADEAVSSDQLAPGSVTLSKLAAADATSAISLSLAAHGCSYLTLNVPGATVGQVAVMTWVGTTNPPQGVMVGPLKVIKTGHVVFSVCNVTGQKIAARNVTVRVTTLG